MANMKYKAVVSINETPRPGRKDVSLGYFKGASVVNLTEIPIGSFSVVGGASRSINLDSTDDISISSELEQARTYKNITLFLPPTKDSAGVELFRLAEREEDDYLPLPGVPAWRGKPTKYFTLFFQVNIFSGGKRTHTLILKSSSAWLKSNPTPVANNLLMLEVQFEKVQLLHGKLNEKSREFVHEEM